MCRENERTHKHHIIPRYMDGTDTAENLVEITVTQHAMYHFCNYQLWGNEEDKIAWCALSGIISSQEAILKSSILGGKKGAKIFKENLKDPNTLKQHSEKCREAFNNSPHKEKIINTLLENQPKAVEASKTPEAIEKKKKKLKEIEHNKGKKNPQYGKMWITNGTKEGTYRINKEEPIPKGYRKGRICYNELKYIYIITTPIGEVVTTNNLQNYCNEKNLNYSCMRRVSVRKRTHYKGHKVTREPINTHKVS